MKVPDTEGNMARCICMNCPTYNQCMKDGMQGLFCARGKTDCEVTQQGCICGECPVSTDYRLAGSYFCMTGAAD